MKMSLEKLFHELFWAGTEKDVDRIIANNPKIFCGDNWCPYGGNNNNFSIIENQQSDPIAALVEKLTNSIDAILMKNCYEKGIDPKSDSAPQSFAEAVERYFPDSANWDLPKNELKQSENIQILAHGPVNGTSLVIYDNGEGQHPKKFESTLLSLMAGNKNEIPFVQGKYNMGGTGALAFCGKKQRYQLIASKRYSGDGAFGFTLCRKHPLQASEKVKNTWYEYLKINDEIPSFQINDLDLGLRNRKFTTGTLIKLYSYGLPSGSKSVISRDLNRSLNEYLFEPALPVCTIDSHDRYPDDQNVQRSLYGLKRRLEENKKYVYKQFSVDGSDPAMGDFKITCYVFNFRIENKSSKSSKNTIRREFFKNNMSVLFSLNGQVHSNFTSEFISRTLKMELLKNHLLIHVDCTDLEQGFCSELFMGSRDRMKSGAQTAALRAKIAEELRNSVLKEIHKEFKNAMTSSGEDASKLLKDVSKNLPLNPELTRLLKHTFTIEESGTKKDDQKKSTRKKRSKKADSPKPNLQRFPSTFNINAQMKGEDQLPLIQLPKGDGRSIQFNTDVQDDYFTRPEDSGDLQLVLLKFSGRKGSGRRKTTPNSIGEILSVSKSTPSDGVIRVHLKATQECKVGDAIHIKATLDSPTKNLEQIFMVKIEKKVKKKKSETKNPPEKLGLPQYVLVRKSRTDASDGGMTWDEIQHVDIDHNTVVSVLTDDDGRLDTIFINMDSSALKNHARTLKNEAQLESAKTRYISTVYFHTLFLYMITKNMNYELKKGPGKSPTTISEYLQDIFANHYSDFLLNFGVGEFMEALGD